MTKIELTKKKKFAFGLAVAAGATLASVVTTTAPAAAIVTVTVNGQQYNIEALPAGSFNSQAAALWNQPWWGDQPLAEQFAIQAEAANSVSGGLGFPNFGGSVSPYFAFDLSEIFFTEVYYWEAPGVVLPAVVSADDNSFSYASATPATPVPLESDGWAILISTTALGLGVKLKQLKNKKKIDLEE